MINKKNLWFLTLFSLVLVLSIYYVSIPNELLVSSNGNIKEEVISEEEDTTSVSIEESDMIAALKVEDNTSTLESINKLKETLTNPTSSIEDKNKAFEELKSINNIASEEETLEQKIKDTYKLSTYIKISGNQIRVVVDSKEHDTKLANSIMRTIQECYDKKMYISVKFNS
jgi:stage III sporulation protein AH